MANITNDKTDWFNLNQQKFDNLLMNSNIDPTNPEELADFVSNLPDEIFDIPGESIKFPSVEYICKHKCKSYGGCFAVNGKNLDLVPDVNCNIIFDENIIPELETIIYTSLSKIPHGEGDLCFACKFGPSVGLQLLDAVHGDTLYEYLKQKAEEYLLGANSRKFSNFTRQVFGHALVPNRKNPNKAATFIINKICSVFDDAKENINNLLNSIDSDMAKARKIAPVVFYDSEFKINYLGQRNNEYIFSINGKEIALFSRTTKKQLLTLPSDLHLICGILKLYVVNGDDLRLLIKLYGMKSVFEILNIIAKNETLQLVRNEITAFRNNRKQYHYLNFFGVKQTYYENELITEIKQIIDCALKDNAKILPLGNASEYKKDKCWVLYDIENEMLSCFTFDFMLIKNDKLRSEIIDLMRNLVQYRTIRSSWNIFNRIKNVVSLVPDLTSILKISNSDLIKIKVKSRENRWSEKTINQQFSAISFLFDFICARDGVDKKNNISDCFIPNPDNNQTIPTTTEDLIRLIKASENAPICVQLILKLLCLTGARLGEILSLQLTDIKTDDDGKPYIERFLSKTLESHSVSRRPSYVSSYILDEIYKQIIQYIEDTKSIREHMNTEYIFIISTHQNKYKDNNSYRIIDAHRFRFELDKITEKSGLPKIRPKYIRAWFGKNAFKSGLSSEEVSLLLGNTPAVSEAHYNMMNTEEEAQHYNQAYEILFSHLNNNSNSNKKATDIMYGKCNSSLLCSDGTNCANCPHLMICKEKGVD